MTVHFNKLDRWNFGIFFALVILVVSPFSFFERKSNLETLTSNRVARGLVLDKPDCPNGYRQKAECRVRIIKTDSIKTFTLPLFLCDNIQIGDTLSLKYSKDLSKYFIDNIKFQESERQEFNLSGIFFLLGLLLFFCCFYKIRLKKS